MKKFIIFTLILISSALFLFTPTTKAQDVNDAIKGLNESAGLVNAFKSSTGTEKNYHNFIQTKTGKIIGVVLSFVGVLFLILMIYAGLRWMFAGGNEQQVSQAKSLMINAIIGIVIVFAAYAITKFIGEQILK